MIHSKLDIDSLSYTDFIALLKETNRCPGGKQTVRRIRELLHIDVTTHILEVGSNNGFTSLEFARISPANLFGIDISESCVRVANETKTIDTPDVQRRVSFQVGSSYDIPFSNETFDIIMAGGATSFMSDKTRALTEYFRVLKQWGFLVMTPLIYHTEPPQMLLDKVSKIIGTKVNPLHAEDWAQKVLGGHTLWELYYQEHHTLSPRADVDIQTHVAYIMNKSHIQELSQDMRRSIEKRWRSHINIFNENHKYLGYAIQIYRKRNAAEEPELFIEQ